MDDTQVVLSTKQVLYNFSLSREQLRRWTEKGLVKLERGKFDLKAILKFRDEFVLGSGHDEMRKAKLRREQAKARYQELLTFEKEGMLVSREDVLSNNLRIINEAKNQFLQLHRILPSKIACLDQRGQGDVIKTEVRLILNRLHRGLTGRRRRVKK